MERNSSGSDSSYVVHVKDEPECLFNQEVREAEVLIEVERIKEELDWDSGASSVGEALEPSDLYPDHEVKDELVLGPEGLQPADIAFTLAQTLAVKRPKVDDGVVDCVVKLERIEEAPRPSTAVTHPSTRQSLTNIPNKTDLADEYSDTNTVKEYYVCALCDWRFKLKSQLKEHAMVHIHVGMEEESVEMGNSKNKSTDVNILLHKCPECDNLYKSQKNMADHIQSAHCIYDCPHCPLSYTYRQLQHHLINVHSSDVVKQKVVSAETAEDHGSDHYDHAYARSKSPLPKVTAFECGTCNKKYKALKQLKRHARTHSRAKPYSNSTGHVSAPAETITVTDSEEEIDVVSLGPQLPLAVPRDSPPAGRQRPRTWHTRHRKCFPSTAVATAAPARYGLRARKRRRVHSDADSDTHTHTDSAIHTHTDRLANHNAMERFRRYCLKKLFDELKQTIPKIKSKEGAPKILIIREATALCNELREEQKRLGKQQHKLVTEFRKLRSKAKRVRL